MTDYALEIRRLLRQQSAIARFGSFALSEPGLQPILDEAARVCAHGLDAPYAKVCRYRPEHDDFIVTAGFGWKEGVVGHVISRADEGSPHGRAFTSGKPEICFDLGKAAGLDLPAFYADHDIVSTVDVLVKGSEQAWGVLEVDNDQQQDYDAHDIDFLTGFANILAEAVSTAERINVLRVTVARMNELVATQERLLDQKKVLAQELHHRVRNNLQLVYGMLSKQLDDTIDEAGQRGLKAIARRVFTLAQVYDQLLGTEMTRTLDLGRYVEALCSNVAEFQRTPDKVVTLECETRSVPIDLDVATAIGIVVAELVTNSYDHAFDNRSGTINVSLGLLADDPSQAKLTIADDGPGFTPQAESKRHGVGLVRRLVEQVGGTLELDSQSGTRWTVLIPTAVPA